jgi:hypothetical protein
MPPEDANGFDAGGSGVEPWKVWAKFVLREIDRHGRCLAKLEEDLRRGFADQARLAEDGVEAIQKQNKEALNQLKDEHHDLIEKFSKRIDTTEKKVDKVNIRIIQITAAVGGGAFVILKFIEFIKSGVIKF